MTKKPQLIQFKLFFEDLPHKVRLPKIKARATLKARPLFPGVHLTLGRTTLLSRKELKRVFGKAKKYYKAKKPKHLEIHIKLTWTKVLLLIVLGGILRPHPTKVIAESPPAKPLKLQSLPKAVETDFAPAEPLVPITSPRPIIRAVQATYNMYDAGQCTAYAWSRRPDLPGNLGNADTWAARAAAQGFATGPTPRVGAIGQKGMHVVYVEAVNGDGTILISEQNFVGPFIVSQRTVDAGAFYYIY